MASTIRFWNILGLSAVLLLSASGDADARRLQLQPRCYGKRPCQYQTPLENGYSPTPALGQSQPEFATDPDGSGQTMSEVVNAFLNPFDSLYERHCLPDDYDWTPAIPAAQACYEHVTKGPLPEECADVLIVPQFYNCIPNSVDQLVMVDGILTFNITDLELFLRSLSNDAEWNSAQAERDLSCRQNAMDSLGPQQLAVYSYLCSQFSLFANCDRLRGGKYELDELSMKQRTAFLEGVCPASPNAVLDSFGLSSPLLAECDQVVYTGDDVQNRYSSAVARVACLLKDFENSDGYLNVPRLMAPISDKFAGSPAESLLSLWETCGSSGGHSVTTEQFVHCWAGEGLAACASFDANLVALTVPETCAIITDFSDD